MELKSGLVGHASTVVCESNTAAAVGSGALPVFSTPHMIALMEGASMDAVAKCLEEGQGTVGTKVNIEHLASSPIGAQIRAESLLVEVDRKRLEFEVKAYAGDELIGKGSHQRFIVDSQRFMEKALAKK